MEGGGGGGLCFPLIPCLIDPRISRLTTTTTRDLLCFRFDETKGTEVQCGKGRGVIVEGWLVFQCLCLTDPRTSRSPSLPNPATSFVSILKKRLRKGWSGGGDGGVGTGRSRACISLTLRTR